MQGTKEKTVVANCQLDDIAVYSIQNKGRYLSEETTVELELECMAS